MIGWKIFFLLVDFAWVYCSLQSPFSTPENSWEQKRAAENVVARLLGSKKAELFVLDVRENGGKDGFTIFKSEKEKKVSISGPNAVSLAWGVNYYLKNYCNCHVSWDGDQIEIPADLPAANETVESIDRYRYYQNVCTSSYSFVWWDWNRWEREIDWMAFNGINLALAFTGQEMMWQRTYDALGLEYNDFTGPAFLAWNRMGNLRNYSYGLTYNWHQQQLSLQHKILKRLRELGILPVLPAFCGIVPRSFEKSYPLANLTKMPKWSKFSDDECCPYLLDPSDPLFSVVSGVFLREYISEFGTNHMYSCDVFNENKPASGNLMYLWRISKSIYSEMSSVDPDAIWLVQGWMFIDPFWISPKRVKAFVTGVPLGKMLILDLQSDLTPQYNRLQSYFGQPFIWCTLHNFGGQLGIYGHLSRVNEGIPRGRKFQNSTMVGIGITPEGIDQNYVMYEFTLESAFRSAPVNLTDWISRYALRRYGVFKEAIEEAWIILLNSLYDFRPESSFRVGPTGSRPARLPSGEHISKNILTRLPNLRMSEPTWCNRSLIFDVFLKFVTASKDGDVRSSPLFGHDLIDVARQTIQTAVSSLYFKLIREYAETDSENFRQTSETLLKILKELDGILGSGRKFLLGSWLESAKSRGSSPDEKRHYEFNARNQITLWGPRGEIRDYAAKQWAGLVSDYYRPRWKIFLGALKESLEENRPCNSSAIREKIFSNVEKPFGFDRKIYSVSPAGDPIEIVREFARNWQSRLYEIFKNLSAHESFIPRDKKNIN